MTEGQGAFLFSGFYSHPVGGYHAAADTAALHIVSGGHAAGHVAAAHKVARLDVSSHAAALDAVTGADAATDVAALDGVSGGHVSGDHAVGAVHRKLRAYIPDAAAEAELHARSVGNACL